MPLLVSSSLIDSQRCAPSDSVRTGKTSERDIMEARRGRIEADDI